MPDALSSPFRVETLHPTYDAFGMVIELLSRHAPFADFRLRRIGPTIRAQLKEGLHVAALSEHNELIGYAGWVRTFQASAELWVAGRGALHVATGAHDAVALTIVVSEARPAISAMMRRCRELNPGLRSYFKRSYDGQLRASRKHSVLTDLSGQPR